MFDGKRPHQYIIYAHNPIIARAGGLSQINKSMRLIDLFESSAMILEGGWDNPVTQGTVITPSVVKKALAQAQRFVRDFNRYLATQGIPPTKLGVPTGSSAYHDVDSEDKIYGDVDLQIVVPEVEATADATTSKAQGYWYGLMDQFAKSENPSYMHPDSEPGHPIFSIGDGGWVQVDFMPHTPRLAKWGAARTIPERGVKGLLHGNMFSVLGDLLTMSIQHAGVQYKDRDGVKQPYPTTRKNYVLKTVSTDPETFVMDIFRHECYEMGIRDPKVDPLLAAHPGKDLKDVKVSNLVDAIKGLARSFEANGMYGKGDLAGYGSAEDFLGKFWSVYEGKAMKDINATKRDKAETPEAKARAEDDKRKILKGLDYVRRSFA